MTKSDEIVLELKLLFNRRFNDHNSRLYATVRFLH